MPRVEISLSKPWIEEPFMHKKMVSTLHDLLSKISCIDSKLLKYSVLELIYHRKGEQGPEHYQMVDVEIKIFRRNKRELEEILGALRRFGTQMKEEAQKQDQGFCMSLYVHFLSQERLIVLKSDRC